MSTEVCGICRSTVSFTDTVHVLIHTKSDEGVVDYYICRQCYDDELAPLFASDETEEADDETGSELEEETEEGDGEETGDDGEETADDLDDESEKPIGLDPDDRDRSVDESGEPVIDIGSGMGAEPEEPEEPDQES